MIKVTEAKRIAGDDFNMYLISAFADTKAEVTSDAVFTGMPKRGKMQTGSNVMTADGDVAFLKSDGTWNWV